ncbi:hypothetical protein RND81_03G061000 [Saponaria officinalis]|uniref:Uncharacterized protein n=1 Tax=Saponaria officinalis TaxID=3572 RepID=A0AAW1M310_SAPOF
MSDFVLLLSECISFVFCKANVSTRNDEIPNSSSQPQQSQESVISSGRAEATATNAAATNATAVGRGRDRGRSSGGAEAGRGGGRSSAGRGKGRVSKMA